MLLSEAKGNINKYSYNYVAEIIFKKTYNTAYFWNNAYYQDMLNSIYQ